MQNKMLRAIVYPLFFLVCLVLFTIQGFPKAVIQTRIEREVHRQFGAKMTAADLDVLFPNGLEATDIRLTKAGQRGKPGFAMLISRAKARISLLGLLWGSREFSFSAELLSGKMEGEVSLSEERSKIDAELHALDLGKLPIWQDLIGLPLAGQITGRLDLDIPPKDIKAARGVIELSLEKGSLGEGKIRGLTLPSISLGQTRANLEVDKGKAEIKTLQIRSDDIEANLEGYFVLQKKLEHLSARCKLRFKPSDDFLGRNAKFQNLIELGGLNQAKAQDGFFTYNVYGRLDHLRFQPSR